jgi:hypothetical protein
MNDPNEKVETKTCSMCKQNLPTTMFAYEGSKGYLRYECRPCAKKHAKIRNKIKKTAPKIPDNHKCPICQRTENELVTYGKNKKTVWVLDHDHTAETFRGWLCHKCNLGLGNLGDDSDRCARAAEYLKKVE